MNKIYWARICIYEPFHMGGGPWIWYKYRCKGARKCTIVVDTEDTKGKFDVFIYLDSYMGLWKVYELNTGGFLAEHENREGALQKAKYDIGRTPDLKEQMDGLEDLNSLPEMSAEKAQEQLAKQKQLAEQRLERDEQRFECEEQRKLKKIQGKRILEL